MQCVSILPIAPCCLFLTTSSTCSQLHNSSRSGSRRVLNAESIEAARANLGLEIFEQEWRSGEQLTIHQVIAEAEQALASSDQDPEPTLRGSRAVSPGGLTRREVDVVKLVASGMSNREIADQLWVSQATAISHMRNIMTKLELDSRSAVAVWAVRNGLA